MRSGDGGDGEADAADDEVRGDLVRSEGEEVDGRCELEGAKDDAIVFEFGDAELQRVADADSEDGGLRRLIGDRRVVVAVDDGDGLGGQEGLHADGLQGSDAHGDEARPSAAGYGATGAHAFKQAEGQLDEIEDCRVGQNGVVNGGSGGHDGNCGVRDAADGFTRDRRGVVFESEQIADSEHLRGEQAVEAG